MQRHGGDIDFRDIIDADCSGRADGCDAGGKICQSAAIQNMVGHVLEDGDLVPARPGPGGRGCGARLTALHRVKD